MNSSRKSLAAFIIAISGFALVPASAALADTVPYSCPVNTTTIGKTTQACGGEVNGTVQACAAVAGVGACAQSANGGPVAGAPGACAWWFHEWTNPPFNSGKSCANAGSCTVVTPAYQNPSDCAV